MAAAPSLSQFVHRHPAAEVVDGFRRHELLVRASAIAFRTLSAGVLLLDALVREEVTGDRQRT